MLQLGALWAAVCTWSRVADLHLGLASVVREPALASQPAAAPPLAGPMP